MSVEITNNTILKILFRRGGSAERENIVLSEGEPGYVVDSKRLYVGDGITQGGIPVDTRFIGSTTDITTIAEPVHLNDIVFKSDTKDLYRLQSGDGSSLSDWEKIASADFVTTDNATLTANVDGDLLVNIISGGNLDPNIFGNGILFSSNTVSLSTGISIDKIVADGSDNINLPNKLVFNNGSSETEYTFPVTGTLYNDYRLATDSNGNLSWQPPISAAAGTVYINSVSVPVGTIMPYASQTLTEPTGWLFCDGRSVAGSTYPDLSAVIGNSYGGDDVNFNLPNLMSDKFPLGVGSVSGIGVEVPVLTGVDITTTFTEQALSSTALSGLSATLSAYPPESVASYLNPLSGLGTFYIIKYQPEIVFEDTFLETSHQVLTSQGLSAYDVTSSVSTSSTGPSGQFALSIPTGDIGTGNQRIVEAFQRARTPQINSYTTPGIYEYVVPDNIYKIKVTATGGGGHGYVKYADDFYRADGTQGGAGGTVIAYVNVEPGQSYRLKVGAGGAADRTSKLENVLSGTGIGDASVFGLSSNSSTIYNDLSANGARETNTNRQVDYASNGYAREGFGGGVPTVPNPSGKIDSSVIINGGDGGCYRDGRTPEGTGGSSYWGTGPAPGGGGTGWSTKDRAGETTAVAGDGIVIVEEL